MKSGLNILLIALTMGAMSGCANMLGHNNYYQAWQEHAYTVRAMQDTQNAYYSSYSSYVVTPTSPYAANSQLMSHYSDSMQYAPNIYINPNVQTPVQAPNSPQYNSGNYNISGYGADQSAAQYEYYAVDPTSMYRANQPMVTAINTHYQTANPTIPAYAVVNPPHNVVKTYPNYTAAPATYHY